ncbi:MAG TPA: acyltransferase [Tepidiformaceae bacterium]|nr:acyltransferase [Tepidiformaceae bacterium]
MASTASARLWRLDVIRGAAIVFVVLMHAYFDPPGWAPDHQAYPARLAYFLGHTVVPLFFLISGFLFAREARHTTRDLARRKAATILVPALLWSLVAVGVRVHSLGLDARQGAIDLVTLNAGGQFFYVFVLLILFGAALPVRHWPAMKLALLALAFAAAGLLRPLALERDWPATNLGAIAAYRDPLLWGGYFLVGMAVAKRPVRLPRSLVPVAALAGATLIAAWFTQAHLTGAYPDSYFSPFVYLFGWLLVLCAAPALPGPAGVPALALRPLEWLGRHSYAIFLAHMPLFIGLVTDAWYPEAALDDYASRVLFRFATGLLGPMALVLLASRVLPARIARYTGFPGRPSAPRGSGLPSPTRRPREA